MTAVKPVVLMILDGWGLDEPGTGNAIEQADTPNFDHLWTRYPHSTLITSGRDVGLTNGQMGNSEVGHLNIGAGFIVNQAITMIDTAIESGEFYANSALLAAARNARESGRRLHLLGLVSDGGVHSHIRHLKALLELCSREGVSNVAIHAILDGRDTSPTGGEGFLEDVRRMCAQSGIGEIVSVIGRYYAMDRDSRWERTRIAYDLLVHGEGEQVADSVVAVRQHYENDNTDEFMAPLSVAPAGQEPVTIQPGDSVVFFNFRSDRPRQLTQALTGPDIEGEPFDDRSTDLTFVTMTEYADFLETLVAFPAVSVENPIARVVSEAGLRQFHTAETEKYAHVTYFINGGREEPFDGEERKLIPSPKVATYDLQPEMSAPEVTRVAWDAIRSGDFDLVIINYANCDMVGHTGVITAAVAATEAVDSGLGSVIEATLEAGGAALVIADHGNAETMLVPETHDPMTAHTVNPVPYILVSPDRSRWRSSRLRNDGRLADVAPTLLQLIDLHQPEVMTGTSLIEDDGA